MKKYPVCIGLCFILGIVAGCNMFKSPTGGDGIPNGSTQNGYFYVFSPMPGSQWIYGLADTIRWIPFAGTYDPSVRISLYKGDTLVQNITSMTANDSVYVWAPYTQVSGTNYRIRISSYQDTSRYDFSGYFSLRSRYFGTISVLNPVGESAPRLGDSMTIRWSAGDSIGSLVRIELFRDSQSIYTVTSSVSAASGSYLWSSIPSSFGSGTRYRIRISSYYDPSIHSFSSYFTLTSGYSGTITVTKPAAKAVVQIGDTLRISWSVTGPVGTFVRIQLYNDTTSQTTIYSMDSTSRWTCLWTVPAGLASGKKYRIRVSSYYDVGIYGVSDTFSIVGVNADLYEPDNNKTSASALMIGSPQVHTMPAYNDTDWVKVTLDSGKTYCFATSGSALTYVYLYSPLDTISSWAYFYSGSSSNGNASLIKTTAARGTYYARITSYSSLYLGSYAFSVVVFDSLATAKFTAPDTNAVWAAGSSYPVTWTPDTALFGTSVYLSIWDDSLKRTVSSSYSSNSGSYTLSVPAGLITGKTYRIKMTSTSGSAAYGYSRRFTVSGISSDSYEPDNVSGSASTLIPAGAAQNHTMTFGDTDWVKIALDSGKTYFFANSGSAAIRVYLYSPLDLVNHLAYYSSSSSSGMASHSRVIIRSGIYYARVVSNSSYYFGDYTFSAAPFDTLKSAKFITPDTSTVWASGSSYSVTWTPDTALFGATVTLSLWDDVNRKPVYTNSYLSNSGTYTFPVPAGLLTGPTYRMRIGNYSNSLIYGYSRSFTISGISTDSYEPDNVPGSASTITPGGAAQNHTIARNDTDWVKFTLDSGKTYIFSNAGSAGSVYVYLYSPLDLVSYLASYSSPSSSGRASYTRAITRSGIYHARIFSSSSSYFGDYSFAVTPFDTMKNAKFISPDSSAVWSSGSSYTATWTPDTALFGTTVTLSLWDDLTKKTLYTAPYVSNGGSATITIPAGLATRSTYRLKLTSTTSSSVYGYCPRFSVSGISPDAFELDDSSGVASEIPASGAVQNRSLTSGDVDWVKFQAIKDSAYIIRMTGSQSYNTFSIYSRPDSSSIASSSGSSPIAYVWKAPATRTAYLRIVPYSTSLSYLGAYTLSVRQTSENSVINFIVPTAQSVLSAGTTYSLQWTPDTSVFGQYVTIQLYRSQTIVESISSNAANSGVFSWTVPAGMASGSEYRIRIGGYGSLSGVSALSSAFTISGTAADTFEVDDSAAVAKTIATDSTAQNRSLTRNNIDWVKFAVQSGRLYRVAVAVAPPLSSASVYLYNGVDFATPLQTATGTTVSAALLTQYCSQSGHWYFKVSSSSSNYGPYSAVVKALDSASYRFTVGVPAAGATLAIGASTTVTWNSQVSIGGYVDIYLYNASGIVQTIVANQANTGTYSWSMSPTLAAGAGYYVRVISRYNAGIYGNSGTFTLQ